MKIDIESYPLIIPKGYQTESDERIFKDLPKVVDEVFQELILKETRKSPVVMLGGRICRSIVFDKCLHERMEKHFTIVIDELFESERQSGKAGMTRELFESQYLCKPENHPDGWYRDLEKKSKKRNLK